MKNTLLPSRPDHAGDCVNMRPCASVRDGYLEPVMAQALIDCRPWKTVGIHIEDNGIMTELFADGSVLGACSHRIDEDTPPPYVVADWLEGEIIDSYRCSDGYVILTDKAMYRAEYDGAGILRCKVNVDVTEYPVPVLSVMSETSMSLPVGAFRLSGSYGQGSVRLQAADADRLRDALYEAYAGGVADAGSDGQYIAPVLARYRLFDRAGNMVMESVPKLLVPTGRHDRSMTTVLSVDTAGGYVLPGGVSVPLFKIGVTLPAATGGVAGQRVGRLEVQVTPCIHSVDPDLSAVHRLDTSSGRLMLHAVLPGCGSSSGKATARYRRDVMKALAGCDSLFETVLSVSDPFKGSGDAGGRTLQVMPVARSLKEERSLLSRAVCGDVPCWLTRCMLPHTVSGRVARRDGDTTVMGNLSVVLFAGHPMEYYANHGSEPDDIETVAVVTFSDGRRLVTRGGGHTWADMRLSPLVVYPDREARSISLIAKGSDMKVRGVTLKLEPCGRFACCLDEDVWPVDPVEGVADWEIPVVVDQVIRYPGNIIVYGGDVPGGDISGKEICMGGINALHPVGQPSSSVWESSRSRYNVMGGDGIFTLSMNGFRISSPVRLDSRPVMRRDAVATVSGGDKGVSVYAIAGGDLVAVSGNKVVTVVRDIDAGMLVWDSVHAELLAVPCGMPDVSRALVYHVDYAGWSTRLLPGVSAVYSSQLVSRVTSMEDGGALLDMCRQVGEVSRCRYSAQPVLDITHQLRGIPFVDEVTVDIAGSHMDGVVTVEGHHGREPWSVFSMLMVEGEVNRPLCHHIVMPARKCVRITVDAVMSVDSRLGGFVVTPVKIMDYDGR